MKISKSTLDVLKNFNSVNPSIVVNPGNIIKTMSPNKAVFAKAVVNEVFPKQFAIYELSKFLSTVSLFSSPDFEFFDDHMKISEAKNFVRYVYANKDLIVQAPDREIALPSKEIYFELTEKDLSTALKALSVLGVPEMSIVGDDGTIYIKANNNSNPTSDSYSIAVGTTQATFNMIFLAENLKFMPRDYKVTVSSKGIAEFASDTLTYWAATTPNSKYGI